MTLPLHPYLLCQLNLTFQGYKHTFLRFKVPLSVFRPWLQSTTGEYIILPQVTFQLSPIVLINDQLSLSHQWEMSPLSCSEWWCKFRPHSGLDACSISDLSLSWVPLTHPVFYDLVSLFLDIWEIDFLFWLIGFYLNSRISWFHEIILLAFWWEPIIGR